MTCTKAVSNAINTTNHDYDSATMSERKNSTMGTNTNYFTPNKTNKNHQKINNHNPTKLTNLKKWNNN